LRVVAIALLLRPSKTPVSSTGTHFSMSNRVGFLALFAV
jgi:hypothetical protein